VTCSPERPFKGFELKVSFNPTLLQATSVSEGDFFHGYSTFFNAGTINNQAGTIINIYDLIVGTGNVTDPGTWISIAFAARTVSGTSPLALYDVRATNETQYIQLSVSSGSITVQGEESPPPNPPPSNPPSNPPSQNQPPLAPSQPIGPGFIEIGTTYTYSCHAIDPDGDQVRIRFDWGDGNMSNWSSFTGSNESVSAPHVWASSSSFTVRAIAQDTGGANSSWSASLSVVASAAQDENQSPVVMFATPINVTSGHDAVFDASGCVDPDGVIVSYLWDFGDGTTGVGKNPTHVYGSPGIYVVTLTVTDDSGLTSSSTQQITVSAEAVVPASGSSAAASYIMYLVLVGVLGVVCGFVVVFRKPLKTMLTQRGSPPVGTSRTRKGIGGTNIEGILDSLFVDMERHRIPLNKETLLDLYCDKIIENVEANPRVALPELNIVQVERIVDDCFHAKVKDKVDKLSNT
jgi:hypothetical protein